MAYSKRKKKKALEMLQDERISTAQVAKELNINVRTVQRWISEIAPNRVAIRSAAQMSGNSKPTASEKPMAQVIKLPVKETEEQIKVIDISQDFAEKLVRMTKSCLDTVEQVLNSKQAKTSDRLKAASLAASWVGLGKTGSCLTVFENIERTLGAKIDDTEERQQNAS